MKVRQLTLENFRGVREFTLYADGQDVTIRGDNGVGKTTIADAFHWLLFGKDSAGRANFEIKTIDRITGKVASGVEHTARMTIETEGGKVTEFEKTYLEKWTRQRGSKEAEFTGNTTRHRINGVEVPQGQYDAAVAAICPESKFRLLCDPFHFSESLKWERRREMLLEIVGDVTDADAIAANPEFSDVPTMLGQHSREAFVSILKANRRDWNARLKELPAIINEASKTATGAPTGDMEDVTEVQAELDRLRDERSGIENGAAIGQLNAELRNIDAELARVKTRIEQEVNAPYLAARKKTAEAAEDLRDCEMALDRARVRQRQAAADHSGAVTELDRLRGVNKEIKARVFEFEDSDTCPTCLQPLAPGQTTKARAEAEARFNQAKAGDLERNQAEGKAAKQREEQLAKTLAAAADDVQQCEAKVATATEALEQSKADEAAAQAAPPNLDADPEYCRLATERQTKLGQIEVVRTDAAGKVDELNRAISAKTGEVQAMMRRNAEREAAAKATARVDELKAEQTRIGKAYDESEAQLDLLDRFVVAKVRMLTERINARFSVVHWRLFDVQVNGAVVECCDATVDGVPWSALSHGQKINAGLDIVNTLADHLGFAPPVIIDNAESVTNITPTRGQQIRLVVAPDIRTLTVAK
jgi:DNA repair exonuclease SbcCD ATPase subunit